ncbi:unnamed protein product [Adineta steineri]|uniref:Peptidase S1 domain-containing protein n=1 Tax=Adineta steineri TaxID=433720 RepID=A0A815E3H4_9BILA|nr:unnamed protein product [Adineta steineri]CAF3569706.1 unnamed protein product [Adineta steineri]
MRYSAYRHRYPVIIAPPKLKPKSNRKKWIICGVICIIILVAIVVIGVGLGVGLGLGLKKSSSSSSSSSDSETGILSPPSVSCTYTSPSVCGCAATQPSFLASKIINGYSAVANSWPWIIVLYYDGSQRCDGFIYDFQHVVTAAHCVYGLSASSLSIAAGVYSLSSFTNVQTRTVSAIQVHTSYSTTTYVNDIAVLKLSSALTGNNYVGLCCVTSDTTLPAVNEHAVIIGWGTTDANTITIPDTLQQAVIEIKTASKCSLSSSATGQFCAGWGTTDTCYGDSGGPLMTSVNNAWTCTGVVSYGTSCNGAGTYTRVSYYKSFIDSAVANL